MPCATVLLAISSLSVSNISQTMKFSKLQETKVQNYKTEKFTIVTELFDVRHQVISRNELQNASVIAHQQMTLY